MAISIASNSETEQDMLDGLKSMGVDISTTESTQVDERGLLPVKEEVAETTTTVPATDTPVEGETAAAPETVEHPSQDKTQETENKEKESPAVAATTENKDDPKEGKEGTKGGTVDKINKLTKRADQLAEALDNERGDRARLQKQLDEVNAKLAQLQPAEETVKEPELVRPKRPTRAQFEFDEVKYEEAMSLYEVAVDDYYSKKSTQDAANLIAENDRRHAEDNATRVAQQAHNEWVKRRDGGRVKFEDWDDVLGPDAPAIDVPPAVQAFIFKSKDPAPIMYYLATHPEERDRIEALPDAADQLIEITLLSTQLSKAATPEPATPEKPLVTKVAATVPVVTTPAKTTSKTPLKTPDAPIAPLGHQASTSASKSLEKAAEEGASAYLKQRLQEQRAKLAR